MTTTLRLDPAHEAHEPPAQRDAVRLMVSKGETEPMHARFRDLPTFLEPGDLVVVNTSATMPAALDGVLPAGDPVAVHLSTALPGDLWLVEIRRPAAGASLPLVVDAPGRVCLLHGGSVDLLRRFNDSQRLWLATVDVDTCVTEYLARHGRAIRYKHVLRDWPLAEYQTVFATVRTQRSHGRRSEGTIDCEQGSAEMPSAARPFTNEIVTALVRSGVGVAPLVLHTGVSSLEGHERPYPERYEVPAATAALINATHEHGGHVIAVGTTVVRALESVADAHGTVHPGAGWTDLVIEPQRTIRSVDGLLTGWHEPEASHLWMLEAVAGRPALDLAYAAAYEAGYLWHEFGDSHLLLPYAER